MRMNEEQIRKIVNRVEKNLPIIQDAIKFCGENGIKSYFSGIKNQVILFYCFDKDPDKAKKAWAEKEEKKKDKKKKDKKKKDSLFDSPDRIFNEQYNYDADLLYSEFAAGINILCNELDIKNPLSRTIDIHDHEEALLRCKAVIETTKSLILN